MSIFETLGKQLSNLFGDIGNKITDSLISKEKYSQQKTSYYDSIAFTTKPETMKKIVDAVQKIPSSRREMPPAYEDYIRYPHRLNHSKDYVRVGDVVFTIPPEFISVQEKAPSTKASTLRARGSINVTRGYSMKDITMVIFFNGENQLNGYEVESPTGKYYVDGIRPLIAQFLVTPYVPIENDLLNNKHGINVVSLNNIHISTIEGFPNTYEVTLTMSEVTLTPYTETPDVLFDNMIDWDLFRFNYQRLMDKKYKLNRYLPMATGDMNNIELLQINSEALTSSKIKSSDIYKEENFTTVIDSKKNDFVLHNISFSANNTILAMQMSGHNVPTSQYLGGTDFIFNLNFGTTDAEVISKITNMQTYTQFLSRQYKDQGSFGFIKIKNPLINMTGTEFLIIDKIDWSTVPGIPGLYEISIACTEFDHRQKEREELIGITPFPDGVKGTKKDAISQDTIGLYNKILQDNIVEGKISRMEMYPDLNLPLYGEVDKFIEQVRTFRTKHNLSQISYSQYPKDYSFIPGKGIAGVYSVFVDPDYYVFYPLQYSMIDNELFNVAYGVSKDMTAVTVNGRSIDWGNAIDAPDGYYIDSKGNLKKKNSTSSESENLSGIGNTGNELADICIAKAKQSCGYVWGASGQIYNKSVRGQLERATGGGSSHYNGTEQWYGHQVFDCSGFVSWGLRQLGIMKEGERDVVSGLMNRFTSSISYNELKAGDLVANGGEHIAIYIGNGKTVEAMNKQKGVCFGTVKGRFNRYGRLKVKAKKSVSANTASSKSTSSKSLPSYDSAANLNKYLGSHSGSKLTGKANLIINECLKYGIDPAFMVAVMMNESAWGCSSACKNHNNPAGIMDWNNNYRTVKHFSSIDEGIKFSISNMYKSCISKGKTTINAIGAVYCPVGAANDNGQNKNWIPIVSSIDKQINKTGKVIVMIGSPGEYSSGEVEDDYQYKKSENDGKVFCATIKELSLVDVGKPIQLESPVNALFVKDKVKNSVSDLFQAICNGDKYILSGIIGPDSDTKEYNELPLYSKAFHYITGVFRPTLKLAYSVIDTIQNFWLVQSITNAAGDILSIGVGNYYENWNYKQLVNAFTKDKDAIMNSMYTDMLTFSKNGRLTKAFPSFLFLIADDSGDWLDGRKLWANFYVYKSIIDISIEQDRTQPVHTAKITLTNYQHNLDTELRADYLYDRIKNDPEYKDALGITQLVYRLTGSLLGSPKLTNDMVNIKNRIYESINLKAGANIHIRMGYGSNAIMYPTVFNGVITDIDTQDVVNIVAQSYGLELINNPISTDKSETNSMFNKGSEPSDVIATIMTERDSTILNTLSKKWGEASKYGIEHYGIPRGVEKLDPQQEYDILKNIYTATYDCNLFCGEGTFDFNDGEENSNFYLYNKLPWDVFQNQTSVMTEFVCQPMYHQFETRLFYGLPFWPAKYRYDFNNGNVTECAKSFAQFHYADSLSEIIDNKLFVSSQDLNTNCVAMYNLAGTVKSAPTVYSDRTIMNNRQRTKVIDTTLKQDYIGWDWLYEKTVAPVAKSAAIRMAISELIDSWNKTYDGDLIILGDTTIKPCDYLMINDLYVNMFGLCGVRQVVHTLSTETGFTTSITPDLISLSTMKNSGAGNVIKSMLEFGETYGAVKNTRYSSIDSTDLIKTQIAVLKNLAVKKYENPILYQAMGIKAKTQIGKFIIDKVSRGDMLAKFGSVLDKLCGNLKGVVNFAKGFKNVSTVASAAETVTAMQAIGETAETAQTALTVAEGTQTALTVSEGAEAGLVAAGSVACPVIGTIAAWAVGTIVFNCILGALIDEFSYNNCIKVFPLIYKKDPFVSGCTGQTKLLIGISEGSDKDSKGNSIPDKNTDKDNQANSQVR